MYSGVSPPARLAPPCGGGHADGGGGRGRDGVPRGGRGCSCGAAGFTEMYMMDFKREAILMCHQGEGNWRLCRADRRPYLKNRVLSEGGLSNPPTPIFTPEPCRACILSLTHLTADRFRLVCAPGEIPPDADLLHVDMPYLFFRPDSGVRSCVTAWLKQGRHTPRGARPGRPARPHPACSAAFGMLNLYSCKSIRGNRYDQKFQPQFRVASGRGVYLCRLPRAALTGESEQALVKLAQEPVEFIRIRLPRVRRF